MKPFEPIVLTGFMGCGKTGVARELARHLNLVMVDLDEEILEREGRSPAELIVEDGEPAFRAVESDTLRNLLQTGAAGVIALGGGAWIGESNRDMIEKHRGLSVWLDAPFEMCWERIEASGAERPLGRTREQARALYEHRRSVYELASIHLQILPEESLDSLAYRIEGELENRG